MNERLRRLLPHRQMVFTFPQVLRVFFRHHRTLYGEIARQVYATIGRFYNTATDSRIHSAAFIAYASAGESARFNPHAHAIVLEGGFDGTGRFVRIPAGSSRTREALAQYIARAPVSLRKLVVDDHAATVLYCSD